MSPKHRNSDAGNSDKKSYRVLPLSENVKALGLMKKKKLMLKLLQSEVKMNLLFEIVKKEK